MTSIAFAGHTLILSPEGTLYWPAESLLAVADLHLGAQRRGLFMPSCGTRETLERLERAIAASGASRILFIGDSFPDTEALERLSFAERDRLEDICGALQAVWVQGHHGGWVPPRARPCEVFSLNGLTFRHEASAAGIAEISAHAHPMADLSPADRERRCFIEDGRKLWMPSFGNFMDGTDVRDPTIAAHFPNGFTAHILGMDRVHSRPVASLAA